MQGGLLNVKQFYKSDVQKDLNIQRVTCLARLLRGMVITWNVIGDLRLIFLIGSSSRKELPEKDNLEKKGKVVTRSSNVLPSASSTGVFQQVCIFCNKKDKKHKGVKQKLTQASTDCFETARRS